MIPQLIIGIAGGSGSGKTFFANQLTQHFSKHQIAQVSLDNYYLPLAAQMKDEKGVENFDLPEAIDHQRLYSDLIKLTSGRPIELKEYHFNQKGVTPKILIIQPCPVIIVEGLFTFYYPQLSKLLDLKIFLEAPEDVMLKRRIARDSHHRGYALNEVIYQFEKHAQPAYKKYILPLKNEANLLISNHHEFDKPLALICDKIKRHLKIVSRH
jgi:uridine kinase